MMRYLSRIFALAAVLGVISAAFLPAFARGDKSRGKARVWADGADARKADYYFMEALRQNSQERDDAFFDLLSASWALDSADTAPGLTLGYYIMALGQQDTAYAARGYNLMRRHFDAHPDDYYGAIFYGMINDRLGNSGESVRVWQTLDSLNPNNSDVALKYAEALMGSNDSLLLRKSVTVTDRIERAEGPDLGLTSHKVRALMALKDTASALGELERFRIASPRNPNFYIYSGDVYSAFQLPDSAIANYDRACLVDSTSGLAYYKRAEFYKNRGDSAAYDREVFKALQMETLDLEVKLEMLGSYIRELYTDTLQRPRIQHLFDVLLTQHPHEPQIRDLYSSYLVALEDYRGAAEQQEVALDAEPSDIRRWLGVMSLYYSADDYAKSTEVGERALHYFPEDGQLNLMLGGNYEQLDRWDDAMGSFRKALAATPESDREQRSQVMAAIGDVFHHKENTDSAFTYYEKALELNPDNLMALNNFAYYLSLEGKDLDRAEKYAGMCVRAQPDNDTFLDTYAWIFFKKKDYAKAKEYIDQAVDIEAEDPQADVWHHAGDIYYMSGEPAEALEFWEEALKLDPGNALLKKKVKYKTHFFE